MASPDRVPGDVISLESTDEDEKSPSHLSEGAGGEDNGDSDDGDDDDDDDDAEPPPLKMASPSSAESRGREEGEVEEEEEEQEETKTKEKAQRATARNHASATRQDQSPPTTPPDDEAPSASLARSTNDSAAKSPRGIASKDDPLQARVYMPEKPALWTRDGLADLQLPALAAERTGSWSARFEDWVRLLHEHNPAHTQSISPATVLEAYSHFLEHHSRLRTSKKKSARQAAQQAETTGHLAALLAALRSAEGQSQGETGEAPAVEAETRPMTPTSGEAGHRPEKEPPGDATTTSSSHPPDYCEPDAEELAQQRRYFPSAADPSKMCLLCAREGHRAAACPFSRCKFCHLDGHGDFGCPSRRRCLKCRRLGHDSVDCAPNPGPREGETEEKREEASCCAFCQSRQHMEDECPDMARSFYPDPDTIKKVTSLPVSCAICASRHHFLSECNERAYPSNPTWSMENHGRYLDAGCGIAAVEEEAAAREKTARRRRLPQPRIRGRAPGTAQVHYSESDDSEADFLGRRLKKPRTGVGQIRMSSNIQMPLGSGAGRISGRLPPPPGLPTAPGSRAPLMSTASLPEKPPAPARSQHEGSGKGSGAPSKGYQGYRGGRADVRGRGRGRGWGSGRARGRGKSRG